MLYATCIAMGQIIKCHIFMVHCVLYVSAVAAQSPTFMYTTTSRDCIVYVE